MKNSNLCNFGIIIEKTKEARDFHQQQQSGFYINLLFNDFMD